MPSRVCACVCLCVSMCACACAVLGAVFLVTSWGDGLVVVLGPCRVGVGARPKHC